MDERGEWSVIYRHFKAPIARKGAVGFVHFKTPMVRNIVVGIC